MEFSINITVDEHTPDHIIADIVHAAGEEAGEAIRIHGRSLEVDEQVSLRVVDPHVQDVTLNRVA